MPVSGLSNCEVTQAGGRGGMMKYCGDYCLFPVSRLTVSVSFFQPWPGHSPTITTYYCNHDDEAKLYPKPRCFPNIIDLFGAKSWSFVPKPNPMCHIIKCIFLFGPCSLCLSFPLFRLSDPLWPFFASCLCFLAFHFPLSSPFFFLLYFFWSLFLLLRYFLCLKLSSVLPVCLLLFVSHVLVVNFFFLSFLCPELVETKHKKLPLLLH